MPFFNNPAVGQSVENLAKLFGPPSGSDLSGYAAAAAKKAETDKLNWLFANPTDANAATISSLLGIQNYGATAEGFNKTDLTNRREQDLKDAASRYSTDRTFDASRLNNSDNNVAAMGRQKTINDTTLTTNAADNARALATNAADNNQKMAGVRFGPIAQGAVLPAMPDSVASLYGLPSSPVVMGNVGANQGETVYGADGKTYAGTAKPKTSDEVLAAIIPTLPTDMQQALAAKGIGTQNVVGPDGKPVVSTDLGAVGKTPYVDPKSVAKPEFGEAILADGTKVPVTAGSDGIWKTQDGKPVPNDARVMDMAKATGSNTDIGAGPKTTEAQDKNAYAATMADRATTDILAAFDTGKLPSVQDYQVFNLMRRMPMEAAPYLVKSMSPEGQAFYQNLRTALPFQLMSQSGQAVSEQEYERKLLELIPIPGEDASVSAAKRSQFATYIKAARGVAGPAYDKIHNNGGIPEPSGTPVPAPGGMSGAIPASGMPNSVSDTLAEARAAIAKGASRDAVIKRLQENGINPEGL